MTDQKFKRLVPTYFNEFQCIGGECEDTCCAGWNITIDKKTYKRYENEKNIALQSNLKKSIMPYKTNTDHSYGKFKLNETNYCSLLSEDGLCTIHALLGPDALSHTCAIYPRDVSLINDTIEKSLLPSCPEATRLIIMQKDGIEFIEEVGEESLSPTHKFKTNPINQSIFWEIRIFLITVLQDRRHSIEYRILLSTMLIEKYSALTDKTIINVQKLCKQYYLLLNEDLKKLFSSINPLYELHLSLAQSLSLYTKSEKFNQISNYFTQAFDLKNKNSKISIELYTKSLNSTYKIFTDNFSYTLENYLVNQVFGLIKHENPAYLINKFTEICIDFTMIRIFMIGYFEAEQVISIDGLVKCIQQISRNFTQNAEYLNQIKEINAQNDISLTAKLAGYILI